MGPGRKCVTDALAHRHCLSAFRQDAGKTRHAKDLEHVADFFNVHALHLWHVSHPQRRGEFRARICAELDWRLVRHLLSHHSGGLHLFLLEKSRSSEERSQT